MVECSRANRVELGQERRKVVEIGGAAIMVRAYARTHTLGGSGGMPPPEQFFKIRCSEIASEAIFVPECH